MADGNLVETMAQEFGCRPEFDGHDLQGDDQRRGQIDEGHQPAAALTVFGRKCQCEMQKERRLQRVGDDLAPVDNLVERR